MRLALVVAALALAAGAAAATHLARERRVEGRADIVFERARLARLPDRLALDARAEVELPDPVRAGLDSGVPLEFVARLEVREPRALWPDPLRVAARWRYRLEYYELTRHYRLGSPDTDESRNYRSLLKALEALGTLRGLTVTGGEGGAPGDDDAALPELRPGDRARLELELDTGALPLPLRPLVSSSWRVRSRPIAWRVGSEGAVDGVADAPRALGS